MLTEEALYERKWGRYPSLGRLLGKQTVPPGYYGYSSVSDNLFNWLNRMAEVAVIAKEHAGSIRATTDADLVRRLPEDLEQLARELLEARRFFEEHAELVRNLRCEVQEDERRRRASGH